MSGASTELGLSLAVDGDDNADYLTIGLSNGLKTLDGLFNNVTGHSHAAAHQGGPITGNAIPDGTITTPKLADGSVSSAKILDGTIQTIDLADGSVTSAKIAVGGVGQANLAANCVTTDKILDGTIVAGDIADRTITAAKLVAGTLTGNEIADGSIGTADLIANAISRYNIARGQTPNPTYAGAAAADLPDTGITFTSAGGDILAWVCCTVQMSVPGAIAGLGIRLDAADAPGIAFPQPTSGTSLTFASNVHLFTGIAAGNHTIVGRWNTNAGTLTAYSTARVLMYLELKR
jgi:hypothetical protein